MMSYDMSMENGSAVFVQTTPWIYRLVNKLLNVNKGHAQNNF